MSEVHGLVVVEIIVVIAVIHVVVQVIVSKSSFSEVSGSFFEDGALE